MAYIEKFVDDELMVFEVEMHSKMLGFGIRQVEEIHEKKELVIGDANNFAMFFPKGPKNFSLAYYQVENLTWEDA